MKHFSIKTGLWTLVVYTIMLSLLAVVRGSAGTPDFGQRVILVALSGFLVGFFLDPLARSVQGSFWKRFGILALFIFSLSIVSNVIETILYLPAVAIAGTIGGGIIQTLILAAILVRFTHPKPAHEEKNEIKFSLNQSILFIVILAVLWIPIYFLFETLDTPVVHLLEHGSRDVFSHPPLTVMLGLEFVRGVIHAGAMLGIVLLARGRQRIIWLWGSVSIAILNGWLLILPVSTLPLGIRIANGCEITLSSITFAGIAALCVPLLKLHKTKNI